MDYDDQLDEYDNYNESDDDYDEYYQSDDEEFIPQSLFDGYKERFSFRDRFNRPKIERSKPLVAGQYISFYDKHQTLRIDQNVASLHVDFSSPTMNLFASDGVIQRISEPSITNIHIITSGDDSIYNHIIDSDVIYYNGKNMMVKFVHCYRMNISCYIN